MIPAITEAGLPEDSVAMFLSGLTTGSFTGIPALTDQVLAAGQRAYKIANAQAFRTVFFTTIAFSGVAVALSLFAPNVDEKMTGQVAVTLSTGRRTGDGEEGIKKGGQKV